MQLDKFKVLDLFSGIGGFSLGLERTGGFETVAFCEIEDYPRKVLNKHWPGVSIYENVRELTAERLLSDGIRPDVITGGFPCQDISVAGKQKGIEAERSGLWTELARIIGEIRPRYAIVENVTALLSGDSGRWFQRVLGDLAEIGYDCEWHCIPASELGAHHHRDRVWIIAYPQGNTVKSSLFQETPRAFFFRSESGRGTGREIPRTHWETHKPQFHQMDDGLPGWVGAVSGYGNAVVPQIPELIGRAILEVEKTEREK